MTPEILEEMIEKAGKRELLSRKLRDVLLLYKAFLDYMDEGYMTSEQVLSLLNEVLERSEKLRSSTIVLDGFTAFSPIQLKLVQGLCGIAKKVYITATIDGREEPYSVLQKTDLFYLSKRMIQSVTAAVQEIGVKPEAPIVCDGTHHRFTQCSDLLFLEQNLFRGGKAACAEEPAHIRLYEYRTAMDEVEGTAVKIRRLVRTRGLRYGEIAVVLGNADYQEHVGRIFARYDIPVFLDEKRNALSHPFVEFLRAFLKMIEENFSYESVFRYLRSGFSGISGAETDILENYCLALGIRGAKKYAEKWIRFSKNQTEEQLAEVNGIREKFQGSFRKCCL